MSFMGPAAAQSCWGGWSCSQPCPRTRDESPSWKYFISSINHHRQKGLNHLRQ